jgi:hypothetical protein
MAKAINDQIITAGIVGIIRTSGEICVSLQHLQIYIQIIRCSTRCGGNVEIDSIFIVYLIRPIKQTWYDGYVSSVRMVCGILGWRRCWNFCRHNRRSSRHKRGMMSRTRRWCRCGFMRRFLCRIRRTRRWRCNRIRRNSRSIIRQMLRSQ